MQAATITLTGNLGADPELRFTPSAVAVVSFVVGSTERRRDAQGEWTDGPVSWWRVTAWRTLAENIAATFAKGDRVLVVGTVRQTSWQDQKSGETRYGTEVIAEEVAASVKFASAKITRTERGETSTERGEATA